MTVQMTFDDNALVLQLFGSHHRNLARIEQKMDVAINARGNEVTIIGDDDAGAEDRIDRFTKPRAWAGVKPDHAATRPIEPAKAEKPATR